MILNMQVCNYN